MATNRTTSAGEQNAQQNQQRTQANSEVANTGRVSTGEPSRDRERSIRTASEQRPQGGVAGRESGSAMSHGATGSPFSLMRRMAEDMDRIFEDFGFAGPSLGSPLFSPTLQSRLGAGGSALRSVWAPQIETFRRGENLVVRADLPGLRREDVHVEVDDGVLTIHGERAEETVDERDDYYRSERSYGRFHRALPLPEGISGDACEATFQDGVLEVTLPLPKERERKARKIQIR